MGFNSAFKGLIFAKHRTEVSQNFRMQHSADYGTVFELPEERDSLVLMVTF